MSKKEQKTIKVDLRSLEAFIKPMKSVKYRVESLLRDHYDETYRLDDESLTTFMEICISTRVALGRIEELQADATEAGVQSLYLFPEEVLLISTLFKTIAAASESSSMTNVSLVKN